MGQRRREELRRQREGEEQVHSVCGVLRLPAWSSTLPVTKCGLVPFSAAASPPVIIYGCSYISTLAPAADAILHAGNCRVAHRGLVPAVRSQLLLAAARLLTESWSQ